MHRLVRFLFIDTISEAAALLPVERRTAPAGRFLSELPVKAFAPMLPMRPSNSEVFTSPPYGTFPDRPPITQTSTELHTRSITSDPRELWYLSLPNKLSPKQVIQILRSGLGGDIWQVWQLTSLMLDSWPMLRKCSEEIRTAVSNVKFISRPYAEDGEEPTETAKAKSDLVKRAMKHFKPDPFTDEKGWAGLVYDITDAMLNGLEISEIIYQDVIHPKFGREILPRAACWVHPRHFTFTNDGKLAIFDSEAHRLTYNLTVKGIEPDPNKFLVTQFRRSGSSLGAGLARPLAWDWSAMIFNRDWMLGFAQKYGNPFLDATYKPGTPDHEIAKLNDFLAQAGNQGFVTHVEGTTIEIHPAQSLGTDNAHERIKREANENCQYLLLGQTATTQGTPGKLGGEDTKAGVKREMVQAVANWVATILTEQFAAAILRLNYGDDSECPTMLADFTEEPDPKQNADRIKVLVDSKIPLDAEEMYETLNMKQPEEGDIVFIGGRLGKLAATDTEVGGDPLTEQGIAGQKEMAREGFSKVQAALAKASDEELKELDVAISAAQSAPHLNGEWGLVRSKLNEFARR